MQLFEKYRPKDWAEVLGQDKAVRLIRAKIERSGAGGQAFWLTGPTGTGKTTIARLIAGALKGARVHEYKCADQLTAAELTDLEAAYHLARRGLFALPTVVIVNEAHGLNSRQVRMLLGLLEPIPESFVWVFTTTWDGQGFLEESAIDAAPLLGRCVGGKPIRLTNQGLAPVIAEWARGIMAREGLDGLPESVYLAAARESKNSFRGALEACESAALVG